MPDYDLTMRVLAREYPEDMVFLALGKRADAVDALNTDLPAVERRADWLVRVRVGAEQGLLQTEFQTEYDRTKLEVMDEYRVRARNIHGLPVFSCIVYLTEEGYPGPGHSQLEEWSFGECQSFFRPREVRLWEIEPEQILAARSVGLIALIPLMKGKGKEPLQQAVRAASAIPEDVPRADAMTAIAVLGGLRYPADTIRRLIRSEAMKQSVIYQEILQEGRDAGREEGLRDFILHTLQNRFQTALDGVAADLESIQSFERLETLAREAVACDSLDAFLKALA